MATNARLELTLALLKPDVTRMPLAVSDVRRRILDSGLLVMATKTGYRMDRARAEQFYSEHHGKFFFNRLVSFMSSGPLHCHVLAGEGAIARWRTMLGPTKVFKTRYEQPSTIRGTFGLTDTRNVAHGSDSRDSAADEIAFFFPEVDQDRVLADAEAAVPDLKFDPRRFVHFV